MIKEAIYKLVNRENLSYETAEQVMDEIMSGEASQIHIGAYLTARFSQEFPRFEAG